MMEMESENQRDAEMWLEAFEAKFEGKGKPYGREEFDKLLGHCAVSCVLCLESLPAQNGKQSSQLTITKAVTDWPAVSFSEELIEAYPDAKVVLTVRDSVDAWYKSACATIGSGIVFGKPATFSQWLLQRIMPRPPTYPAIQKTFEYSCLSNMPQLGKQSYLEHIEKIKALVSPERLLVFNVKDGWAPLCEFLDLPVPETPFPRVNDSKAWLEMAVNSRRQGIRRLLTRLIKYATVVGVLTVAAYIGLKGYRF
jgi:Sulfotransferase domain